MTNRHEDILSAFVDEETSAFESRRSIKELIADAGQRSRWERYHLIRDTLRGNLPPIVDKAFCCKVMTAIDRVTDVDMPDEQNRSRSYELLKPVAGVALAASVAVVTVLTVKTLTDQNPSMENGAVAQLQPRNQQVASNRGFETQDSAAPSNPREEARLNSYLVNHAEYASKRSLIPYARIVGYDMHQR